LALSGASCGRASILRTGLGSSHLLGRTGDRRLCLLDARAAVLWDLYASGCDAQELAGLLTEGFGLPPGQAWRQVQAQLDQWRNAGVIDAPSGPAADALWRLDQPLDPLLPRRLQELPVPGPWRVTVADRTVGIVPDPALRCVLAPWQGRMTGAADTPVEHRLDLHGSPAGWQLHVDQRPFDEGAGYDAAQVALWRALTEIGCRPAERLIVLHAAGLVAPNGRGLLLVAPGGSGKTTLAAALNADGFELLSDDVVPVALDGGLLALGLPLSLKPGSWPLLKARRQDLEALPVIDRLGVPVRWLPPRGQAVRRPVRPGLLLLSRHVAGQLAAVEPATPEQVLQGIIEADSVLRGLDQAKLEALARWIEAVPAYTLTYPDLDTGLARIQELLVDVTEAVSA
jgi:hypothetical protein